MLRFVEEHYAEELTVQLIAGAWPSARAPVCAVSGRCWASRPSSTSSSTGWKKAAELLRSTRLKTGEIGAGAASPMALLYQDLPGDKTLHSQKNTV